MRKRKMRDYDLLWTPEAKAAFEEMHALETPAWRRKLSAQNTPDFPQANFEHKAVLAAAREKYRLRMEEIARMYA